MTLAHIERSGIAEPLRLQTPMSVRARSSKSTPRHAVDENRAMFVMKRDRTSFVIVASVGINQSASKFWAEVELQYNSACVGMICWPGSGTTAIARIVESGLSGAAMPGAIAVLGYDPNVVNVLARAICRDGWASKHLNQIGSNAELELPSIAFRLQVNDPVLLEAMQKCRTLREFGIPITVDLIEPAVLPGDDPLTEELQEFFKRHLVEYFPRMF